MRLLTLELMSFGPFTNAVIDFSAVGRPGLHVVYGPNEAGKSAALRAITGLFYGIPGQTSDSFLHGPGDLRIGGRIRHPDGSELAFIRRKGNKNTVLDRDEKPLDDSVLQKYLSGVSREMFAGMFGIDHERLREGGRQIIAGEGDVAVGLYAAALGIGNLRDVLRELRNEAEGLFKATGKTPRINRLLSEYKDLRKQVADLSLPGREWLQHREAVESAEADLAGTVAGLVRLGGVLNRLQRLEKAIPLLADRKSAIREAASMGDVRLLDADFGKERRVEEAKLHGAREAVKRASTAIEQLDLEMKGLPVRQEILSQEALIKDMQERLGSHRKARADEPQLRARMDLLRADALLILREFAPHLDHDAVETFRLPEVKKIRIQDLGARFQSHQAIRERAAAEAKKTEADLAAARTALGKIDAPKNPADLKRAVRQAQSRGDLDGQLAALQDRMRQDTVEVEIALRSLPLWTGDLEHLEKLPFPLTETAQRFEQTFRDVAVRWEGNEERLGEAKSLAEDVLRQMETLQHAGAIPTEEDLERARARRDAGWKLVRRSWLKDASGPEALREFDPENDLPSAYEAAVRGADEIADRLRREADRVAQLAHLLAGRGACMSRIAEFEGLRGELAAEHTRIEGEWAALWRMAGMEPLSPKEMQSWLGKREKLLEKASALRLLRIEADRMEAILARERQRLGACLEGLSEPGAVPGETMAGLLQRCEETVGRIETSSRKREKLEEKIREIETRSASVAEESRQAETRMVEWRKPWAECMRALGLEPDATPIEANAALTRNQDMLSKMDEAGRLAARIEGIRRDAEAFAADSRKLMERVAPDLLGLPVEQAVGELYTRFNRASKAAATLEQLLKRKEEQSGLLRESRLAVEGASARLDELCRKAGCQRHEELEGAEKQSERMRFLRDKIERLDAQLTTLSGGAGLEAFIAEAGDADADAIPLQMAETALQIAENETRRSELERRIGSGRTLLAAMDGEGKALEAAEKAESALARMREEAERYARLHLASILLSREIERYRETNQGPVLRLASEIFSKLTLGSFASLKPVFDRGDRPVLAGFRPSGQKVPVGGMSEGTVDQLYLALRLASLEMQAESGETMPFVIDDILINFDDSRSEAALKVLAELSRKTQIVFFTHHLHLLDLVETASPEGLLKVHRLDGN